MTYSIDRWWEGCSAGALREIADLWNANATGRHAFFPWTGELLSGLLGADERLLGRIFAARDGRGRLIGLIHAALTHEDAYPRAGVVEMLLVDAAWRGRGVGTALLREAVHLLASLPVRPEFIDAFGAWPFGYIYNTLADGSERSGVFLREPEVYRLFRRAGFEPVRKSIVMRTDLSRARARPVPPGAGFYIGRRYENTWLDRVFRGRELWDHNLGLTDNRLLSRAIFGLMEGESRREGRTIFSLFGVNTPHDRQRKGYAGVNLSNLMSHVRDLGGEVMELHVYADNIPALALYHGLGFEPVAETMMMHLPV